VAYTAARRLQGRPLGELGRRPALRLRVLATRGRLDAELAAGVHPNRTEALKLRAAQLLRPRYRRRLAAALHQRLVDALRGPQWTSAIPVVRDQVSDASGTLLSLAQVLRASEDVHPRGVVMVSSLLRDGASPFYLQTAPGELERCAQVSLDCLVGQPWVSAED
jgi:hypothetical protein